ncbi:hypothetical protein BD408DRAFT_418045 [Parasitella parasitica]|nr:hypothetical protein BD408DRAFT_418045 [Parasitella parasitica]
MKVYFAWLISLFLMTSASAVDRPTASLPATSGGIICAMSLCPTATLSKREITCPLYCKNNCQIVDDQCCPGVQKAVCNTFSSSIIESSKLVTSSSTAAATSSSNMIATSLITEPLTSSMSTQPSQSIAKNTPSSGETTGIVWISIVSTSAFTVFMIVWGG